MTSVNKVVWGREFELEVYPEGDGDITAEQSLALERLFSAWDAVNQAVSAVREYCAKDSDGKDMSNVFRYVIPRYLFVPCAQEKRTVALMCDYRFDLEHGLALVFEDEHLKDIGPQDIIL